MGLKTHKHLNSRVAAIVTALSTHDLFWVSNSQKSLETPIGSLRWRVQQVEEGAE
jgi:hypothetical protein